jgi:ABC-2 type transport system permease protein
MRTILKQIAAISKRELAIFAHRPLFLFCIVIAPIFIIIYFTTLMGNGLPVDLPVGMVDMDNTYVTRILGRTLDSFGETKIVAHYADFAQARDAMQRGEIYAILYIPRNTTVDALSNKQPKISFYINDCYFVPGSLLMKDLKTASVLAGVALTRETLYAKGADERTAMGILQPLETENHALMNPTLNYSVYLTNILVPGILILLILLSTTYSIGIEWKRNSQGKWFGMAGNSVPIALLGKLLPQTILFFTIAIFYDVYLYKYLCFPCNCGILNMIGISMLVVLASQAFGIFLFGLFSGFMRLAMCLCSLWGILSFSLGGFTFPTTAMSPILQSLAYLFPLRHFYLIYVNQALDGYPIAYVWSSVVALFVFLLLPFFVMHRYRIAFEHYKYMP